METALIIVITAIIAFFLGYHFAKMRYCVKETKEALEVMTSHIAGEIDSEQAFAKMKEICDRVGIE